MEQKYKLAGEAIHFLIALLTVSLSLIQGASGSIQLAVSGGGGDGSSSVAMNIRASNQAAVDSQVTISGAIVTPTTRIIGPTSRFNETHEAHDSTGKKASVSVDVIKATNGLTYASQVLPNEGSVSAQPLVSAEQWLTVPKADSIKCTASASYGTTRSASVGLEEAKGALAGDYVTLTGYYGKGLTTDDSVLASQTATSGAANSIKIYGTSKDSSGTYSVNTLLKGISGGMATSTGLSETSSAGTITQETQKEHVHGTFSSTATFKPTTGTSKTVTRTSSYGTEYDLNMLANRVGSSSMATGTLGYYVDINNPIANRIQGAVNAAATGDSVNVASGKYLENVKIDKSLTLNGAGKGSTIVDGKKTGSVFTVGKVNANVDVTLSGMTVKLVQRPMAQASGIRAEQKF